MRPPFEVRDGVYISNGSVAREFGDEFEHVITLSRGGGPDLNVGPHEYTTQHFPLYDGPQTEYADFEKAVGATIKAIETHDGSVLVHCQAGVSRSATVLITALAHIDEVAWDEARREVWEAKPSIVPNTALVEHAYEFLGEDGSPFRNPF